MLGLRLGNLGAFCWEPVRPLVTPGLWRDGAKRFPVSSSFIFLLSVCKRNVMSSLTWSWMGLFS